MRWKSREYVARSDELVRTGSRETPYGLSKRAGEAAVRAHASRMQSKALIYRLPSVFGKWCRPNYNSVVATFCHQIARGQPIRIDNADTELHLAFIDDVVQEFLNALNGRECIDADGNGVITETYSIRLGALAEMLAGFRDSRITLRLPKMDDPLKESCIVRSCPICRNGTSNIPL